MHPVLEHCRSLPRQVVCTGEVLIEEGVPTGNIYVLVRGAFDVVREGVRVVRVTDPGSFLGEISALLGASPTANVVAAEDGEVLIIEDAARSVKGDAELTYAIAQLLARRLQAVTAYLVDIKRQYADTDTHLALMDRVLANLIAMQPQGSRMGSERADVPDY